MEQSGVVLNVDWLAVSVRFEQTPLWDGAKFDQSVKVVRLSHTNVWEDRIVFFNEYGDKLCTVLSRPRAKSLFEPNVGLVEIANEWLYHGCGWPFIFSVVKAGMPFEILSISRVDLCTDFNPTTLQQGIILGLGEGKYYVAGKRSGCSFWATMPQSYPAEPFENCDKNIIKAWNARLAPWVYGKKIPHSQSWGHKTSNVKWKLYYKTKELKEVEDKPYIRDAWLAAGLDPLDVWRLEVSIHYPHGMTLAERPITYDIFNREWFSIMRSFYQSRFQVKANEGHADRSNDQGIDFIPQLSDGGVSVKVRPPINEQRRNGRISLLRKLVQSVNDDAVLRNDNCREGVFALAEQIVNEDELYDYFVGMTNMDFASWMEDARVKAYTLCGV